MGARIDLRGLLVWMVLASACGPGETSVALWFPNEVSRSAVRRLRIEAYSPDTGGAAASERDCSDFAELAREGQEPLGTPVRGDYQCADAPNSPCKLDWFDGQELLRVPPGRQIIYVLGYASTEEDATPTLEGCTDRFDSKGGGDETFEVPIQLQLVVPDSARLVKSAGDRQVGRSAEELAVPLEVRVEADSPSGAGGTYVIPGVPISFDSAAPGFRLVSGTDAAKYATFSDAQGRASVRVQLPDAAGTGEILASAEALEVANASRSRQTFTVSVTEQVTFATTEVLDLGGAEHPIAVALGDVDGAGGLDLAALRCSGELAGCTPGILATGTLGATRLTVVKDVGRPATRAVLTTPGNLGIHPADVSIGDFARPPGVDEIAVLNSRRGECQARTCVAGQPCPCYGVGPGGACPCEGSEILVLRADAGGVVLDRRYTMTGSNAVSLSQIRSTQNAPYLGLAMAAQGRSKNERPCSLANRCLPFDPAQLPMCATTPENCGCPPAERCDCAGCASTNDPGVCAARDKLIDVLVTTRQDDRVLYNRGGCQRPRLVCDNNNPLESICECLDSAELGNMCTGNDGCNCRVPDRVYVGDTDAPVLPYAVAAGPLNSAQDWDMVVASIGGLEMIAAQPSAATYRWRGEPIVNAPIHDLAIAPLDFAAETELGSAHPADVVWYSRAKCLGGSNFASACPIWRELPQGTDIKGCLGVYYTDGQPSVFTLRTPSVGGCRRHSLTFAPHGLCTGRFNSDEHVDVALASLDTNELYVFSGDGRGGLLDPPVAIPLPGNGTGGPIACGDLDGDGRDDVVVLGRTGTISVLRTGPP